MLHAVGLGCHTTFYPMRGIGVALIRTIADSRESRERDYRVAGAVNGLLQLLDAFQRVINTSGVPICRLSAGFAVGAVFAQFEGQHPLE